MSEIARERETTSEKEIELARERDVGVCGATGGLRKTLVC